MPSFKPIVILSENLDSLPKVKGQVIFTKDPAELYVDFDIDNRVKISGDDGSSGEKGDPGKSAYELAQDEGYEGSLNDWLASLVGESGLPGENGTTFIPNVDADGNLSWSNEDGKQNPETVNIKGPKGEKGINGNLYTQLSTLYVLDKELWIDNLQTIEIDLDVDKLNDIKITIGEQEKWTQYGVYPVAESNIGISFKCKTIPNEDLSFKVATYTSGESSSRNIEATLLASGWSDEVPYTQTLTIEGLTDADSPILGIALTSSNRELALREHEQWGYVTDAETGNNSLTVYCYEDKPTIDLNMTIKVV